MATKDLNKVSLIGRVGRDPEIRYTSSGRAVANFSLATGESWKDQDGNMQERTEWHRIVIWGKLAEICGEYVRKGMKLYLEGRIQSREWEDQEGNARTSVEVICHDMIMLSFSNDDNGGQRQDRPKSQPQQPQRQQQTNRVQTQQNRPSSGRSDRSAPPPEPDLLF